MGPYVALIFKSPLFLHPKFMYGRRCLTLKGNVRHALSTWAPHEIHVVMEAIKLGISPSALLKPTGCTPC